MLEIRSRKGSTTVFVCIIFSSVMVMVFMFIAAAGMKASASYSSAVLNLAGRSVLSEFDERLKDQYNLIAFRGDAADIEGKMMTYAEYSLDRNRYMKIEDICADLKEYSLMNVDIFREQVTEDGIVFKGRKREAGKVSGSERELRSSVILNGLPSHGIDLDTPGIRSLKNSIKEHPDGENIIKKGTKTALTNEYVMQYFNSGAYAVSDRDTFFKGEIEYILEGTPSDSGNLRKVKGDLVELRTMLNSIYLWSSEVRKAEAMAAAELLTPGPEAVITQAALIELWAAAEAENDVSILLDGGKISLIKTGESWNLDLESALHPAEQELKGDESGLTYDEYLKLLLCCLSDETKYLRMMDLIQINLQGTYDGDFSVRDMYTGFSFTASVNGREFEYVENY